MTCQSREKLDLIQLVSATIGSLSILLILLTYWTFRRVLRSSLISLFNRKLVVMLVYSLCVVAASIQHVQDNFHLSKIVVLTLYPSFIILSSLEVAIIMEFLFSVSGGIQSRRNLARDKMKGRLYLALIAATTAVVLFELVYEMQVYPGGGYWDNAEFQDTGSGNHTDDYYDTHTNGFQPYVRTSYTYTSSAVFCFVVLLSLVNMIKTQQYLKTCPKMRTATTRLFIRLIVIYVVIWCPLATFQGGLADVNCPRAGKTWDNVGYKIWYIFCAISNGGTGLFDAIAWFRFPAVQKEVHIWFDWTIWCMRRTASRALSTASSSSRRDDPGDPRYAPLTEPGEEGLAASKAYPQVGECDGLSKANLAPPQSVEDDTTSGAAGYRPPTASTGRRMPPRRTILERLATGDLFSDDPVSDLLKLEKIEDPNGKRLSTSAPAHLTMASSGFQSRAADGPGGPMKSGGAMAGGGTGEASWAVDGAAVVDTHMAATLEAGEQSHSGVWLVPPGATPRAPPPGDTPLGSAPHDNPSKFKRISTDRKSVV